MFVPVGIYKHRCSFILLLSLTIFPIKALLPFKCFILKLACLIPWSFQPNVAC